MIKRLASLKELWNIYLIWLFLLLFLFYHCYFCLIAIIDIIVIIIVIISITFINIVIVWNQPLEGVLKNRFFLNLDNLPKEWLCVGGSNDYFLIKLQHGSLRSVKMNYFSDYYQDFSLKHLSTRVLGHRHYHYVLSL